MDTIPEIMLENTTSAAFLHATQKHKLKNEHNRMVGTNYMCKPKAAINEQWARSDT